MVTTKDLNAKAFQELILYYMRERIILKNIEIKHLIITNLYEWFIFDVKQIDRLFAQDTEFVNSFQEFELKRLADVTTDFFYKQIAAPQIQKLEDQIVFTHFDLKKEEKTLRNENKSDDVRLVSIYKLLSPEHLLKLPFVNDSNSLDKKFYNELLHIIGLTEVKEGSKKLIQRKKVSDRNLGSILEEAIIQLDSSEKISRLDNPSQYGKNKEERLFNVALELSITWINRILFLKLLEAQLISYHKADESFSFLNSDLIKSYDDLNSLFFQVLARMHTERNSDVKEVFKKVPYLNSSLFEATELEHITLMISNLRDNKKIPILTQSVLKDNHGKKRTGELNTLEYLFEFLNSYDFTSEGSEEIQEENKSLINASVLGLIFEKINGYKDGSYFTPGFITMYMSKETVRKAVVQKFNETKKWECKDLDEVYNKIDDPKEANKIINSLKICDPAVGSGHFLVSVLNEVIAVKHELNVLCDLKGRRLKEYEIHVENDELFVADEDGHLFEYNPKNKESQRIQETLFHEKQTIIENCLFGVDINPNSVKICRLRLWIELLKNAYYKNETELETLPNIDINIKCGNSLVSRFTLDADLGKALKKSKWSVDKYRKAVDTYRNASTKDEKRDMEKFISDVKHAFRDEFAKNDAKELKLKKTKGEIFNLVNQQDLFEATAKQKKDLEKQIDHLKSEESKLEAEIEAIKSNKIYENAFEWRFEFPEVLDDDGNFIGFDVVIGNPPWGASLTSELKEYLKIKFINIDSSTPNTYAYFIGLSYEICHSLITQILPDSILVKDYCKTRKLCTNNLYNLSWYQNTAIPDSVRLFIDVEHDVCTLFINKNENPTKATIKTRIYRNSKVIESEIQSNKSSFILTEYDNTFNILLKPKDISILNKLRKHNIIDNILQCHEGIHSGNIREKLFIKNKNIGNEKPMFLGGKNGDKIENYISYMDGWFVDYRHEIIDKHKKEYASLRDENIFIKPKIYLTRTGNPFKAFLDESNYASNNFFSIQFKDYSKNSYEKLIPILGLLNSKFANYYIRTIIAPSLGNTFVETKIIHLLKLPINKGILDSLEVIKTVNSLLQIKKQDPSADITALEDQIDQLVYQLYELTPDEIAIVEGGVK